LLTPAQGSGMRRQRALNRPQGGATHQTHPWPFGQTSCMERNQSSVCGYRTISIASAEDVLTLSV